MQSWWISEKQLNHFAKKASLEECLQYLLRQFIGMIGICPLATMKKNIFRYPKQIARKINSAKNEINSLPSSPCT